jgi:hypothetical protein
MNAQNLDGHVKSGKRNDVRHGERKNVEDQKEKVDAVEQDKEHETTWSGNERGQMKVSRNEMIVRPMYDVRLVCEPNAVEGGH